MRGRKRKSQEPGASTGRGKPDAGIMGRGRFLRLNHPLEAAANIIVFAVLYWYLLSIFDPKLLLLNTITTGGDTASHYYPAKFLQEELIPEGHIIGWLPGWYGGMPLFQFYFPVLFVLIAFLGYVIPLQISFKLVSVLGIFLLPLTTFWAMRVMRFRFPMPIIAAAFTMPFLFMESHSMWGGNIPSTLAGEFTYGTSMSLMVLLLAMLYRGLEDGRWALRNAVFMAVVCLTHVYTIIFTVASIPYLYVSDSFGQFRRKMLYSLRVYPLALMLTGFWLIPLLARHRWTAVYDFVWDITEDVMPVLLWPFLLLAILGLHFMIINQDKRAGSMLWSIIAALILFKFASYMGAGMVDIRFLPFAYLYMLYMAAYGFSEVVKRFEGLWVVPLIVVFLTLFWVNEYNAPLPEGGLSFDFLVKELEGFNYHGFTPGWVKWNYEGFEKKSRWPEFKAVNDFLNGTANDPRVKFEHNDHHNEAGTVRAFESLPLFSGRSEPEGLYMQSMHTSVFSFYIQSEMSEQQSCPYWHMYPCTQFDIENGTRHMIMFNIKDVIARSDKLKQALGNRSDYRLVFRDEPYEVWELLNNTNHYVTVPAYEPVLFKTGRWMNDSYNWFRNVSLDDVPLVFVEDVTEDDRKVFKNVKEDGMLTDLPRVPLDNRCHITENYTHDEINFTTDCVGKPHIISVSYYPSWKPIGADRVYLVSPSFMMVIPNQPTVRLVYSKLPEDYIGLFFSFTGLAIVVFGMAYYRVERVRKAVDGSWAGRLYGNLAG